MHNKIRPFALLLILWTIPAAAQPLSSSSSHYAVQFDPDKVLCVPTQMHFALDRVSDTFWLTVRNNPQGVFLATDHENQLYLLEQISQRKLLHIDVAGTFIEMVAVAKDDDGLRIEAMFQTAGGANPHQVALRLSPTADGWQAQIVDTPASHRADSGVRDARGVLRQLRHQAPPDRQHEYPLDNPLCGAPGKW